ncbi:MAG TPA: terminase family protein [Polyangiaceae bacterium]|jgi:hypothetical protein|nr:terminase family protein [Polyangiaceae bacterium]
MAKRRVITEFVEIDRRSQVAEVAAIGPSLETSIRHALNPVAWAREELGFVCDVYQQLALLTPCNLILLACGRQVGKTSIACLAGLHHALFRPNALVLIVAPSMRQSGEAFGTMKRFLESMKTPAAIVEESKTQCTFANGSRVVVVPASETSRGFGAVSMLIEDEAAFTPDSVLATLRPALATTGGKHLLLSSPNGQVGHFFTLFNGTEPAERIRVRSTDCARIDAEYLAQEKRTKSARDFAQEYEASFEDREGAAFLGDLVLRALTDDFGPLFTVPKIATPIDDFADLFGRPRPTPPALNQRKIWGGVRIRGQA